MMLKMKEDQVQVHYENSWQEVISELLDQYPVLLFTSINVYGFVSEISSLEDVQKTTNILNTWGPV
jgi:hypothetical protein